MGWIYVQAYSEEGIPAPSTKNFVDVAAALPPPLGGTIAMVMAKIRFAAVCRHVLKKYLKDTFTYLVFNN